MCCGNHLQPRTWPLKGWVSWGQTDTQVCPLKPGTQLFLISPSQHSFSQVYSFLPVSLDSALPLFRSSWISLLSPPAPLQERVRARAHTHTHTHLVFWLRGRKAFFLHWPGGKTLEYPQFCPLTVTNQNCACVPDSPWIRWIFWNIFLTVWARGRSGYK